MTAHQLHEVAAQLQQVASQFCRGVDRRDREIIEGAYWPDAYDDHGLYHGDPSGFAKWVTELCAQMGFMQHTISNIHILGVKDDVAASETYYHMRCIGIDGELAHAFGRYLDKWEHRGGQWRIANRLTTLEWTSPNSGFNTADFSSGTFDRTDPSYELGATVGWSHQA
jgi:hypothetical protein